MSGAEGGTRERTYSCMIVGPDSRRPAQRGISVTCYFLKFYITQMFHYCCLGPPDLNSSHCPDVSAQCKGIELVAIN